MEDLSDMANNFFSTTGYSCGSGLDNFRSTRRKRDRIGSTPNRADNGARWMGE